MRSNRASKTGIQLKMFRKQLTKQFRGLSIIHTVEQCEGSNFSSGSQRLNLVRDEVILRKVNDPDSMPLDSIQLWQWGRSSTKPCRAGIFHLWSDDGLVDHCSLSGKQICRPFLKQECGKQAIPNKSRWTILLSAFGTRERRFFIQSQLPLRWKWVWDHFSSFLEMTRYKRASVKGRLQSPTTVFGRLSLFRTIETAWNWTEPPVNRQLGFEVVPKS